MKTRACLLIFILRINFLFAQDVTFQEFIEPQSEFKELKQRLKDNPLPQIEKAFIQWDYELIKPYLHKSIRKSCKSAFKVNEEAMAKYTWKKQTHHGPVNAVNAIGNFGVKKELNLVRLLSDKDHETFLVEYYYYVQDSSLVIYALESLRYPDNNQFRSKLALLVLTDSCIQTLRKSTSQKDTKGMAEYLSALESLKPSLIKLPNFSELGYFQNLASSYSNLSWYLIFEKKYESAIAAAQKGIAYDETQTWIYTNAALSNLLAGHKDIALEIYGRYKNQQTDTKKPFRTAFKEDLLEAKKSDLIGAPLYDEIILYLDK